MRRGIRNRRGTALLLALFFMSVLSLLAVAFIRLVPVEMNSALKDRFDTQGFYAADAGVVAAVAWLERQVLDGNEPLGAYTTSTLSDDPTDAAFPKVFGTSGNVTGFPSTFPDANSAGWTYAVTIAPDSLTFPRGGEVSNRVYRIKSTSSYNGKPQRTVEVIVGQDTFARFGFFMDQTTPGLVVHVKENQGVQTGDTHVNGVLEALVDSGFWGSSLPYFWEGRVTAKTRDTASSSYDGIKYHSSERPYNTTTGAPIPGRYEKLLKGGRDSLVIPVDEIPLPKSKSSADVAKVAWFGRSLASDTLPTISAGTNINKDGTGKAVGGVYVEGNVREIKMRVVDENGTAKSRESSGANAGKIVGGNSQIRIMPEFESMIENTTEANRYEEITYVNEAAMNIAGPCYVDGTFYPSGYTVAAGAQKTVLRRPPNSIHNNSGTEKDYNVYETYGGETNGVVFINGDVGKSYVSESNANSSSHRPGSALLGVPGTDQNQGSVTHGGGISGINKGKHTFAANMAGTAKGHIRINGDLERADTPPGSLPTQTTDGLGIVGYDIIFGEEVPRASSNPLDLYCLLFAGKRTDSNTPTGGGLMMEDWAHGAQGTWRVWGSLIEGQDYCWGYVNGAGWSVSQFKHDPELSRTPPPAFPTAGKFVVMAYKEYFAESGNI